MSAECTSRRLCVCVCVCVWHHSDIYLILKKWNDNIKTNPVLYSGMAFRKEHFFSLSAFLTHARTVCPLANNSFTRCEPTYPDAPVTATIEGERGRAWLIFTLVFGSRLSEDAEVRWRRKVKIRVAMTLDWTTRTKTPRGWGILSINVGLLHYQRQQRWTTDPTHLSVCRQACSAARCTKYGL